VIREPSPRPRAPSPIASPQAGALAVRPATANSKEAGLLPVTAAAVRPSINQPDITRKQHRSPLNRWRMRKPDRPSGFDF